MSLLLLLPCILVLLAEAGEASDVAFAGTVKHRIRKSNAEVVDTATVPAYPTIATPASRNETSSCRLDLSDELFGGVAEACGDGVLDRNRCCPVLAAWLFAAHARSALQPPPPSTSPTDQSLSDGDLPAMPDSDSQICTAALQASLEARQIHLPRPNSTCDAALCFCGIRLHEIGSLSCPNAFGGVDASGVRSNNISAATTPKAALRALERECGNSSYAGCTRCLSSLQKLKGGGGGGGDGREGRMMKRDCQLMGLTWLLSLNKTEYIPTVSAVLRAVLYSAHPQQYRCSPDEENMPLAVDALHFYDHYSSPSSSSSIRRLYALHFLLFALFVFESRLSMI